MLQIFLADDNVLARKALYSSSIWKENACMIAGEASNGIEALDGIRKIRPDIAILDIKMPGMNGLDVIRQIKAEKSECICIILTGYNDFSFAQQSVRLGVFDFLLKPVSDSDLLTVLLEAKTYIKRKRRDKKKLLNLQRYAACYRDRLIDSPMEQSLLLADSLNGSSIATDRLYAGFSSGTRTLPYCIMLLTAVSCTDSLKKEFAEYQRRVLSEYCRDRKFKSVGCMVEDGYAIFLLFQLKQDEATRITVGIANAVYAENDRHGYSVTIGISSVSRRPEKIAVLFKQAVFAARNHFFLENRHVFQYATGRSGQEDDYRLLEKLHELYSIIRKDPENTTACVESLFAFLRKNQECDFVFVKNILVHIGIIFSETARDKGLPVKNIHDIVSEVSAIKRFDQAEKWVASYSSDLRSSMEQTARIGKTPACRQILDFLNEHYSEKISLQDVASLVRLSVGQVCRILKAETGSTYVVLLNKIRIRAAIRLLQEGSLKVYEIAEAVGFSNYAYFYQLFRKETGVPPTEFKTLNPSV